MVSFESCDNLRRELEQILSEGENLVDEDEYLIDLIAKGNSPKKALGLVKELKEEGNLLFKKGFIDEALENYGYAGVVLTKFIFKEEEERVMFFDLAIAILLNLSACLSKKNEFVLVGRVCSIILDYSPNKVKAFYRRAEAAIKLGKLDLAYWDLLLAMEIDPKNQEVSKKLEEVKCYFHKNDPNLNGKSEAPIGLGVSLPPAKNPKRKLVKNGVMDQVQPYEDNCAMESCKGENKMLKVEKGYMTDACASGLSTVNPSSTTSQDVQLNRPQGVSNSEKVDVSNEDKIEEEGEDVCSIISTSSSCVSDASQVSYKNEKPNIMAKHQFHNQKKQSLITINARDYHLMTQGKTLKFYNSKTRSFMEVRIASELVEKSTLKNGSNNGGNQCQMQSGGQENFKEEAQDSLNVIEKMEDCGSCLSFDDARQDCIQLKCSLDNSDPHAYQDTVDSQFYFSAKSEFKVKKRLFGQDFGVNHFQKSSRRRRSLCVKNDVSFSSTNAFFGCRSDSRRKRKGIHLPPREFFRPKKKCTPCVSSYCHSDKCLDYGCQVCDMCSDNVNSDSVSPMNMALGHSNG